MGETLDLLVVGGGVNGAGVARDAAGRGLSTLLVEARDLGGATSSASSKLIHGGLRYLEQYAFRLVRESLLEREVLLRAAPHIVWPLRFILPHHQGLRPAFILRTGLFIYDALAGRTRLPAARTVRLDAPGSERPLQDAYRLGFAYSDCWVEDARLVVLTARDAQTRGAEIRPHTRLVAAGADGAHWRAVIEGGDGAKRTVRARAIVNAAGPWVGDVLRAAGSRRANRTPRLVKGSHIIVPRFHAGPEAFTFQNADGRVVFAIPYEGRFTLIGTTDIPYADDPRTVSASAEEIAYLCSAFNQYARTPITPADVVWTYSGVRPLYDDGAVNASAVTRDYVFDLEGGANEPILLSIYGGKLTTFRKLAEHALRDLAKLMSVPGAPWTAQAPLPGGDIPNADYEAFLADALRRYPWAPPAMIARLCRAYGSQIAAVLGSAQALGDLGQRFAADLTEAELDYLKREEWAGAADDVLWRRSKLGLHMSPAEREAVAAWFVRA